MAAQSDAILFTTSPDDGRTTKLWRIDSSGSGLVEVPDGDQKRPVALSPDGVTVYYLKLDPAISRTLPEIWRRPLAGGQEERVGDVQQAGPPVFSPDGERFYRTLEQAFRAPERIEVVATSDERVLRTITMPDTSSSPVGWAPSSDAVLFVRTLNGAENVWRLPTDGSPVTELTRFGPGEFGYTFTYTADGTRLLFLQQERAPGEVLQFRNFR